jgi:ABC-type multidrug transport system fused ATPase/permease subunit
MVVIAGIAYSLSQSAGGISASLPVLGALALGAQKIMPQMQQIYFGVVSVGGSQQALFDVLALLEQPILIEEASPVPSIPTNLKHSIKLCNLSFRYRQETPEILKDLNLEIVRGSRVGFIGKTGSGKSTVIDLIMGLLEPTSGCIKIDGLSLNKKNRGEWQSRIAHVPQTIYLADSTIAENIAFGVDTHLIDHERVQDAARKAQLSEFIGTLAARYQTAVGERGVRLSGGQRQRIGLARALYKNADLLILDEATSALDDATENAVMQSINSLGNEITVLMIAHRTSTLSNCDRIFELEDGRLKKEYGYEELKQLKEITATDA